MLRVNAAARAVVKLDDAATDNSCKLTLNLDLQMDIDYLYNIAIGMLFTLSILWNLPML